MKSIYETTPELYFDYKKGRTRQSWGKVMIGVGVPSFVALSIATIDCNCNSSLNIVKTRYSGWEKESRTRVSRGYVKLFSLLTLTSAAVIYGGFYLKKSGKLKIRKGIESHNKSLHQTHYIPEYRFGLSPTGIALTLNF